MRQVRFILTLSSLLLVMPTAMTQQSSEVLPKVTHHSEPTYPPLARRTRIQGEVRVKVTTNGESVLNAEAETGHPLLRKAAEDNVRTWTFVEHTPATFQVTFRFKLLSSDVSVEFLESPAIVQIAASPPQIDIYYAWIGLGKWKAQVKSAHGKTSRVFTLAYSGPDADWLSVNVEGPEAETEEIGFAHKEGNFLVFAKTLTLSDGAHVKTLFIGKMSGDKIVGTTVDDTGIRGEWTAVRIADR